MLVGWLLVDGILAAASAALGTSLTDPVDLGGSGRSTVLRCHAASGGTVVVKSYPRTAQGAGCFATEASGLAFTSDAGVGPGLLGTDPAVPLIVMADLGDAPSLDDRAASKGRAARGGLRLTGCHGRRVTGRLSR